MNNTSDSKHDTQTFLSKNEKPVEAMAMKNGALDHEKNERPVEKQNARRWFVMVASFVCNGLIFGLINSVSVIYKELHHTLESQGVNDASTKASFVGSLAIGMTFFLSPVAGILTDNVGIRRTAFLGGLLASGGLLVSSFFVENVEVLYFTYGILNGVGASLAYTPSLAILGHYFTDSLAGVNGFVTAGSSVFTLGFPYLLDGLIKTVGLEGCFQTLSLLFTLLMVCAVIFKPVTLGPPAKAAHNHTLKAKLATLIYVENWKKKRYVIWACALPVSLFGYFVSYVHLVKFVELNFPGYDGKILIQCIAITSLMGRLVFGKIADLPRIDKLLLQQISFVCMGILTILIVTANNFYILIAIALGMGIFDGCFISLIGPIAFDICGHKGASQGIGFVLGLCSIPMTLGPPLAGFVYDRTDSYSAAFILSGVMPLLGAAIMCLMRCVKEVPEGGALDPAAEPLRATDVELVAKTNGFKGPVGNGSTPHTLTANVPVLTDSLAKPDIKNSR